MKIAVIAGLFTFIALPSWAAKLTDWGTVVLQGKKLAVRVARTENGYSGKDFIQVGEEKFSISTLGGDEMNGRRSITKNGKTVLDKSIMITTSIDALKRAKANPKAFAREVSLGNAAEFACGEKYNALILIGDDLNPPYPLIGNCLELLPAAGR